MRDASDHKDAAISRVWTWCVDAGGFRRVLERRDGCLLLHQEVQIPLWLLAASVSVCTNARSSGHASGLRKWQPVAGRAGVDAKLKPGPYESRGRGRRARSASRSRSRKTDDGFKHDRPACFHFPCGQLSVGLRDRARQTGRNVGIPLLTSLRLEATNQTHSVLPGHHGSHAC